VVARAQRLLMTRARVWSTCSVNTQASFPGFSGDSNARQCTLARRRAFLALFSGSSVFGIVKRLNAAAYLHIMPVSVSDSAPSRLASSSGLAALRSIA
jgi:hypothetical protein